MSSACLPAHLHLRSATADDHARVDAAFTRFSLDEVDAYGRFLTAHARCVLPIEAALAEGGRGRWSPRSPLLREDLAALDLAVPFPLSAPVLDDEAAAWGACYVLEGSRLGGALLSRRVSTGLPRAYLSAVHPSGHWRALLAALDGALADEARQERAVAAARAVFALFACAAELDDAGPRC